MLIDAGVEVNAKDNRGNTPLYHAAVNNAAAVAKVRAGAEVNAKHNGGWTPLHGAAAMNAAAIAKLLIANGAEVKAKNNNGDTPLQKARDANAAEVAELLLADRAQAAPKGTEAKGKCGETLTKIDEAIRAANDFLSNEQATALVRRAAGAREYLAQAQSAMSAAKRHCN